MARPVRIEYSGAHYNVMDQGNHREDIFIKDSDRHAFIIALTDCCQTISVKIIAYVLMPNHFHLLFQTAHSNLSAFMPS